MRFNFNGRIFRRQDIKSQKGGTSERFFNNSLIKMNHRSVKSLQNSLFNFKDIWQKA